MMRRMPASLSAVLAWFAAVLGLLAWRARPRRLALPSRRISARERQLSAWAARHGWTLTHGTDLDRADAIERVMRLAGTPGDGDIRVDGSTRRTHPSDRVTDDFPGGFAPSRRWLAGHVLIRPSAAGLDAVIECCPDDEHDPRVIASIATDASCDPFTLDFMSRSLLGRVRLRSEGRDPITGEEPALATLFGGVRSPPGCGCSPESSCSRSRASCRRRTPVISWTDCARSIDGCRAVPTSARCVERARRPRRRGNNRAYSALCCA
jgi:hypothetical protein